MYLSLGVIQAIKWFPVKLAKYSVPKRFHLNTPKGLNPADRINRNIWIKGFTGVLT